MKKKTQTLRELGFEYLNNILQQNFWKTVCVCCKLSVAVLMSVDAVGRTRTTRTTPCMSGKKRPPKHVQITL